MNDSRPSLSSHIPPLIAITCYLAYPKQLCINPRLLRMLSLIHTGWVSVFSLWIFLSLSRILYNDGIVFQSNHYFQNPQFDTVVYWFCICKYCELFDTFILYLGGMSNLGKQKYHHIGTLVFSHLFYVYKVDAIWLLAISNSLPHITQYLYWFCRLLELKQIYLIRYSAFTGIAQLLCLGYYPLVKYKPPNETNSKYMIIVMGTVFVWSLIGIIIPKRIQKILKKLDTDQWKIYTIYTRYKTRCE